MLLKLSRKRQIFFERALIHTRHVVLEGLPPTSGANKLVNFKTVAFQLYPQRPAALEDVCLYDFVANYDYYTKDKNGDRKYQN